MALAPMAKEIPGLEDYLKANLNATVLKMDLEKLLECDVQITPALQSVCLPALGAALRQEERVL